MQSKDEAGWKTPRLSDRKSCVRNMDHGFSVGAEGKGRLPAALVRPFPPGEEECGMQRELALPDYLRRPQNSPSQYPSPHLLDFQSGTPVSSIKSTFRSQRTVSPSPNLMHTVHSPNSSRDIELFSLRNQVQDIQNKLNGDIVSSAEYQQLNYEKGKLEEALGATEHELQQLQTAYNDLESNASAIERNAKAELCELKEKYQMITDKQKGTSQELFRLTEYLRELPTLDEHQQLQHQLARKSAQTTHLSQKIDHLTQKLAHLTQKESEQESVIVSLKQEKEDLALKLGLTEKILKDFETQKATAHEEGQHSKEDLLWRLDQVTKELDSAKKLLNYRKQKLELQQKEILAQEQKHNKKLQAEIEHSENLKEHVWDLEKEIEDYKIQEEKIKLNLDKAAEKQKKTEERLDVALNQVKAQHQTSSTITSLVAHICNAVRQLKDLVAVSQQISQGSLPDICVLLDFADMDITEDGGLLTVDGLREKLTEVRGLIKDLDGVRLALQEQHAKQLASNISCAQM